MMELTASKRAMKVELSFNCKGLQAMAEETQSVLASSDFSVHSLAEFKNQIIQLIDSKRLFKHLTVPTGGTHELIIDLIPTEEYRAALATLRASQANGIGVGHG